MKNSTTTNTLVAVIAIAIAAFSSGCAGAPVMPCTAGDIAVAVPVSSSDGSVEVVVTGTDMARPVFAQLEIEDGVARGTVQGIDAGNNRLVMISTRTADGRRCAREFSADVAESGVTAIDGGALECQARHTVQPQGIAITRDFTSEFPPIL